MQSCSENELKGLMEDIKNKLPDFPITLKDLKSPKAQFMTGYFCAVLKDSGVDTTGLMFHPKCGLDYRDVNAHILAIMKLFHLVKAFFPEEVGLLQHMSIDTFLDPKPSDIQYIKAMNNFHQFSVRRVLKISENPVINEQTAKVSNSEELWIKNDQLQEMVTQQIEEGHLMESRICELIDGTKKLNEESVRLKSLLENEQKVTKEFKEIETNALREIGKLQEELSAEDQQYKSLAPQLVQSPERILLTKEEHKRKLELLRKEMADLSAQMSAMKKSKKEIETTERFLQSFSEGLEAVLSDSKEVKAKELGSSAVNTEQEHKRTKIANKVKKIHMVEKTIEEYKSQQVAPFEEKIKELERKQEEISKSFVDLQSRILEEPSDEKLQEDFLRLRIQHDEELQALGKDYHYIQEKCKGFIVETRQTWAAVVEKEREELRTLKEEAEKELRRLFSE